ncbi:Pnap_2097 family protein [uncultured Sphingomonas sp.]|uniref:Pnap_2097 family protein n=1 Tax=uncultured Sphingomonas sp. TaxID=158754 RepID=UPI0025FAC283|nr:Pnap_2097 family protein [uncultured Sphingomonas sp.]
MIENVIDRLSVRFAKDGQYESIALRKRFQKRYGIDVGMYTIGAFDRWRIPPGTTIGRYSSIAGSARLVEANHAVDRLTTHPFLYLPEFGIVDHDLETTPQIIGDDVWIGHNATILPGCRHIGRGAVIGAGSIVMTDVPAYAIFSGVPAKLVRFRFPAEVRAAIEKTRWWELDKAALTAGLKAVPDFATNVTVETAKAFYRAVHGTDMPWEERSAAEQQVQLPHLPRAELTPLVRREWPEFDEADYTKPLTALPLDSFALINLRVAVESAIGGQMHDAAWGSLTRLEDLVGERAPFAASADPAAAPAALSAAPPAQMHVAQQQRSAGSGGEVRHYALNMPQMALKGLSEAWLFKELGDIHWSILLRSLGTSSAALTDAAGDRLYATFTRIRLRSNAPLTAFKENDALTLSMTEQRYGAAMFFATAEIDGPGGHATAELMTTFSKYGEAGVNTSLLKGTPVIPPGFPIPECAALPELGQEYRQRRAEPVGETLFETEYEQLPPHDINGVGLLYFAAYPSIAEICLTRYAGRGFAFDFSVEERDVMYFANAEPSEILVVKLHEWEQTEDRIRYRASINRKSDEKVMARITATKVRIG